MANLSKFIKEKRGAVGLSQKNLGNISGVSDTAIHNIEIGKTKNPSWDLLCKIAMALNCHPFEIMKAAGYITDDDISPSHLIKGLDKLDRHAMDTVQLFIDFMIAQENTKDSRKEDSNHAV